MTDKDTPDQGEELASHGTNIPPEDSKRKLYFALIAFFGVVAVFGLMRLGNLSGMGAGQGTKPQCTPKFTTCVLDCNKAGVVISQKLQSSSTIAAKAKWEKQLQAAQTTCIPICYQVHCKGKTHKEAAKAIQLKAKLRIKK